MSDDLLARLRGRANADWRGYPPDAIYAAAADRIEQLEAERGTLAEVVRLLNVSTEPYAEGETVWWLVTADGDPALTPDQAERFQRALDRITKETSDE